MKPEKIFLVRHGQSEGNIDRQKYSYIPDYAIKLTEEGKAQAREAGNYLWENRAHNCYLNQGRIECDPKQFFFYISPFFRTRQTVEQITHDWPEDSFSYREDPRIREQEWNGRLATSTPEEYDALEAERDAYGSFYYRFDRGESCADVYDRISLFLDTLWRDFDKPEFPRNVAIIAHGMSIRIFLMRWFRLSVEDFERIRNPKNGQIISMTLDPETDKYRLDKELEQWPTPTHPYQMPISL